jgi:arabinose-5-phosphate isomerase
LQSHDLCPWISGQISLVFRNFFEQTSGQSTMKNPIDPAASAISAVACFSEGLSQLQDAVGDPQMRSVIAGAADLIFAMKGRLIISGVGKSGHVARKLAATFASTGTPAYFVHAAEASHGDLGMIQNDDVLMLLSWSGETGELADIIAYAARFDVPIVAITGKADGTLARRAQYPIVLPAAQEACPHNLAPTTSTLLQMAMGDALAITCIKFNTLKRYRRSPISSLGPKGSEAHSF